MKYLIFDLDHTLLNKQRQVSEYTLKILKKYQKRGHKLVINTARSLAYSMPYIEQIEPDYSIVNAGAMVVDKNLHPIFKLEIDAATTNKIIQALYGVARNLSVDNDQGFFVSDPNYRTQDAIYYDFSKGFQQPASKIVVQIIEPSLVVDLVQTYGLEHSQYINSPWHRISPAGCSKWNGVLALLAHTGDQIKDTITFGDDIGDLEMLEKAGLGVAMANSIPQVLAKIKTVAKSHDEDGVADFIDKMFTD